jgi:hypothetical protein
MTVLLLSPVLWAVIAYALFCVLRDLAERIG